MMKGLAFAAALLLAGPAWADMSYPPERYDIGGQTVAEVDQNYRDIFGANAPGITVVSVGGALAECDRLWRQAYGLPYPAAETAGGQILFGCMVRDDRNWIIPRIVVSEDPLNPELVVRLIRHEVGHLLGWEGTHPR